MPELRRNGDRFMLAACILSAMVAVGIGAYYFQLAIALKVSAVLLTAAGALFFLARGTWLSSLLFPVILASFVALHIHAGMGRLEFHFGVFASLAFFSVYRHWAPIAVGAAAFAVHHLLFNQLQAMGFPVYCLTRPDFFTILGHAAYVIVQAAFGIVMAINMRRDAILMAELDELTSALNSTTEKIDFAATRLPVTTPSAKRLQHALNTIESAVESVRRSIFSLQSTSREISSGNQNLAERTVHNAEGLQQCANSMQQLIGVVTHSADSASKASVLAADSMQSAQTGSDAASEMSECMDAITKSSHKIADITGVIDDIAFQTNILALNAAVEAARAGESGRGFAVVASEVRALAQRSTVAAKDIKELITLSVRQVDAGASIADTTISSLQGITADVSTVNNLMIELADATSTQLAEINSVSAIVADVDRATQSNSTLVQETSKAASKLADEANELDKAVTVFVVSR